MKNHEELSFLLNIKLSDERELEFRRECTPIERVLENGSLKEMGPITEREINAYVEAKVKRRLIYIMSDAPWDKARFMLANFDKEKAKVIELRKHYLQDLTEVEKLMLGWYDDIRIGK